jgi:molecular chaperone DnaK (HSP70)
MVETAKAAEEEDQARFEAVATRNKLDTMIYQAENTLSDEEIQLDPDSEEALRSAITEAQAAMDANENLEEAYTNLENAVHKISKELFENSDLNDATPEEDYDLEEDDVIDADFEEAD